MGKDTRYEWSLLEDNAAIKAEFRGYSGGLVRSQPEDWVMQPQTADMVPSYRAMEVRHSDVWIVTFPKCGTTWSQEMIWQIMHGVPGFTGEGRKDLNQRFPFLEMDTLLDIAHIMPNFFKRLIFILIVWLSTLRLLRPSSWLGYANFKERLDDTPRGERRFIKTHLPLSLLPPGLLRTAKVVYVVRNPMDTMVSYYHHHKLINAHGYVGDLPNFAKRFMQNEVMMGPFFPHAEEAWAAKDHPNMLFVFYEDMKKDLRSVIARVSEFLEAPLTAEQTDRLVDHLDIKNFRNNPAVNPTNMAKKVGFMSGPGNFVRKGKVGGWREDLAEEPELQAELQRWVAGQVAASSVPFRL